MDTSSDSQVPKDPISKSRLDRLISPKNQKAQKLSPAYSRFIKQMRLILPLVAIIILAALFLWPTQKDTLEPLPQKDASAYKNIKKNELTNPRFETVDNKGQLYNITAQTTVQASADENVILLEKPFADVTLKTKNWVGLEANKGAYDQISEQVFLKESVRVFHDTGYELYTEALHINMKEGTAWSDLFVKAIGPEGTIQAAGGLQANHEMQHLVFLGPAKLTLHDVEMLNNL